MTLIRSGSVFVVALAVNGAALSGARTVLAQAPNTCTLLTHDEVQTLVPNEHAIVSDGTPAATEAVDARSCRYTWGEGTGRYSLSVNLNPAARMFAGESADAIKRNLLSLVRPGTEDGPITDVGDAAIFKANSTAYASATAYVKDRILQVSLDGFDAVDKRDALVSLLKKAAAKL